MSGQHLPPPTARGWCSIAAVAVAPWLTLTALVLWVTR